ncbi:MAG: dipeptidase, partial [Aeriscardovia aeriphila]|nr:dipeptidase [Aeriscardovia aeriphila]
ADAHFKDNLAHLERYQEKTLAFGHQVLSATDKAAAQLVDSTDFDNLELPEVQKLLEAANNKIATQLKKDTEALLDSVLYTTSMHMRNGFFLSDN